MSGSQKNNRSEEALSEGQQEHSEERREAPKPPKTPTLIAIAGGKGGLGGSFFCVNAAVYLAQMGNRVITVDGDLGAANLHSLLGVEPPENTLSSFMNREVESLEAIKVQTRIPNLELISGGTDPLNAISLKHVQRQRLAAHVSQLEADYTLLDVGAGVGPNSLDLFLAAKLGVVVTTPEPTSIEVTYRFLRAAFFRRLALMRWPSVLERRISFLQDQATGLPGPTPRELLEEVLLNDKELASQISRELWLFRPAILVNQTRGRSDPEVGETIRSVCQRRLGIHVELLGYLEYDDNAWISVRRRRPLLSENEESPAARQISQAVHRMMSALQHKAQLGPPPEPEAQASEPQTHYEVLELEPGASEEEVRRAQKKMRLLYADDSVGLYGVLRPREIEAIQRKVTEASETLLDPERRRAYDTALFPEGHPGLSWIEEMRLRSLKSKQAAPKEERPQPAAPTKANTPTRPNPPQPVKSSPTPSKPLTQADVPEVGGAWLRSLRESRGIALVDIATRTKIQLANLQQIEDEAFDKMSAPVYVRGFVFEYARYLRLDAEMVARAYVERYRSWLDNQSARAR